MRRPWRNGDGALVAVQLPGQYFEQGGLAGAVFAQQAHPLPLVDLKGDAVQNIVAHLKGLDQAVDLYLNHRSSRKLLHQLLKAHGVGRLDQHGGVGLQLALSIVGSASSLVAKCSTSPPLMAAPSAILRGLFADGDHKVNAQHGRQSAHVVVGLVRQVPQLAHIAQHRHLPVARRSWPESPAPP